MHNIVDILKAVELYALKVNFMICKLYIIRRICDQDFKINKFKGQIQDKFFPAKVWIYNGNLKT